MTLDEATLEDLFIELTKRFRTVLLSASKAAPHSDVHTVEVYYSTGDQTTMLGLLNVHHAKMLREILARDPNGGQDLL